MLSSWALSRIQSEIEEFRKNQFWQFYRSHYKLEKRLGVPPEDETYLCYDGSCSDNGGCGFIITNRGIYGKGWLKVTTHFISYEKLARIRNFDLSFAASGVTANGELIAYYDHEPNSLIDLIERIAKIARQDLGM